MDKAKKNKTFITTDRVRSEEEQIYFFEKCHESFKKALDNTKEISFFYKIAEKKIKIDFAGENLVNDLTPALKHLEVDSFVNADLNICVWDSNSASVEAPPRPCDWNDFTDRGDIWGFNSKRIKTAFHWIECSVNVMDHKKNTAVFWIQNNEKLPFWVKASPFRTIFHWFMEKNSCQLLHAAAVGTEDGAVLITGKGGVGKSSTALNCLGSKMLYLADDYLITKLSPTPTVYNLYNTAKLNADNLGNFPKFKDLVDNSHKLEKEKAVMFLYPELNDQLVNKLPIKAILTPQIKKQKESRLSSVEKILVERSILFTTMSQLPNVGKHTHTYINNLTSKLPGFTLELGSDLKKIPETIKNFLKNPYEFKDLKNVKRKNKKNIKKEPLVTVVIPVYNGERFIKEAIENIVSQDYPSLEIIVVDDGSTDNTVKIIEELPYDIRLFKNEGNCGPSITRNRGIRDVSGEYITFLDVDDYWPENNLKLLVNEITSDPSLELVHGYAQVIRFNKQVGDYDYVGSPKDSFKYYIGAGIYKKDVFNKVGLFNENLRYAEDEDWYRRVYEQGINIKRLEDTTLFVRRHEGNMTKGKDFTQLNALKVFKLSIDRIRRKESA